MWCRDLEGLNDYTEVHVRDKYTSNSEQSLINFQSVEIYKFIINIVNMLPDHKRTIDSKYLIEHLISDFILQHYETGNLFQKDLKIRN